MFRSGSPFRSRSPAYQRKRSLSRDDEDYDVDLRKNIVEVLRIMNKLFEYSVDSRYVVQYYVAYVFDVQIYSDLIKLPELRAANLQFPSDSWDHIFASAKDLITGMLCTNPAQRLTTSKVLGKTGVRSEDYSLILQGEEWAGQQTNNLKETPRTKQPVAKPEELGKMEGGEEANIIHYPCRLCTLWRLFNDHISFTYPAMGRRLSDRCNTETAPERLFIATSFTDCIVFCHLEIFCHAPQHGNVIRTYFEVYPITKLGSQFK
ncbi:hypothetical protein IFM89_003143 [Coptis chinensis]|uniref:Uncharacterized protein n=1 Tax=Coptis chinensis TaxID=261450 RepID=A0A835LY75_9MAGN|nr:hypothetical protein IFM89_003143 [Coptis chinensis]